MGGFFEFLKNNSSNANNANSTRVWGIQMVDRTTGETRIFNIVARTRDEAKNIAIREYGHAYSLKRL